MSDYPVDEFDQLATSDGPVGVHRKRPSVLGRILTPILIFVLAGGLAYGVSWYLWRESGGIGLPPTGPLPTPTITLTEIVAPSITPTPTPTPSPSPSEIAPPVDLSLSVAVFNGAGVSGLAASQQKELQDNGFSSVTAGNLTGSKPAQNTVRYADESQAPTAARVAEVLGIAAVEQGTTSGAAIDVLLVTNPDA